jgi:UDP-glucose 4-epimerase
MANERSLVTGAAGFIGSHVAEHCRRLGMQVVATDNLSGGVAANVPSGIPLVVGDLTDPEFVRDLWEKQGPFDCVYHLGAYAAEGLSHFVRRFNYQTNLVASINLINASVTGRVQRFVFASSIAVYGAGQLPLREETVPHPEDPYGISKYAVELDLQAAAAMFGLRYTVFRPHNVYGERQNIADRYRNVVGIFMNQVLQSKPMSVFGDGLQTRAFTHVDDVAPYIALAPRVPGAEGKVFNIGSDRPYTVLELANQVAAAFGVAPEVLHLEARNEVVHAVSDHTRFREVFQPGPEVSLESGLARMAAWVRSQGPAVPTVFRDIEIREKLPASWR